MYRFAPAEKPSSARYSEPALSREGEKTSDATGSLRTESLRRCPLCGEDRFEKLYAGLRDELHGTPGRWSYQRCHVCGLIFLSPRPTPHDIGKTYDCSTYGTHDSSALPNRLSRRLRSYVRRGYLDRRYGFATASGPLQRLAGYLIYMNPGEKDFVDAIAGHLAGKRDGSVLDVGCGSGENLNDLRQPGWRLVGVDPDPQAVESAVRNHGLDVSVGTLEQQGYPEASFDAVLMSHVIEHVHDPVGLLNECRRVLKPGGVLVAATPNAESVGHRIFGADWRVIEPPRHLTVFSRRTLSRAAGLAGLAPSDLRTEPRGAGSIFYLSHRLRKARASAERQGPVSSWPASVPWRLLGYLYSHVVWLMLRRLPQAGEELLMVAIREDRR